MVGGLRCVDSKSGCIIMFGRRSIAPSRTTRFTSGGGGRTGLIYRVSRVTTIGEAAIASGFVNDIGEFGEQLLGADRIVQIALVGGKSAASMFNEDVKVCNGANDTPLLSRTKGGRRRGGGCVRIVARIFVSGNIRLAGEVNVAGHLGHDRSFKGYRCCTVGFDGSVGGKRSLVDRSGRRWCILASIKRFG